MDRIRFPSNLNSLTVARYEWRLSFEQQLSSLQKSLLSGYQMGQKPEMLCQIMFGAAFEGLEANKVYRAGGVRNKKL